MTPYVIARAEPADVPALVTLLDQLFRIERDFHPDATVQKRGLDLLLAEPDRAVVLVARRAGRVVGMATVQLVVSTASGGLSGWIEDVVVDAAHRGQGIGRALLDAAAQWAETRGAVRVQLLADRTNTPALAFYAQQGWSTTRMQALRKTLGKAGGV